MKTIFKNLGQKGCLAAVALLLTAPITRARGADSTAAARSSKVEDNGSNSTTSDVLIETGSPARDGTRKTIPWRGVSTSEASEALSAQLDLSPGVGVLVTYVAPDSPAAKSGLRK